MNFQITLAEKEFILLFKINRVIFNRVFGSFPSRGFSCCTKYEKSMYRKMVQFVACLHIHLTRKWAQKAVNFKQVGCQTCFPNWIITTTGKQSAQARWKYPFVWCVVVSEEEIEKKQNTKGIEIIIC